MGGGVIMAWINPNSVTANGWTDAPNAIDGDTATSATNPGSGRNTWGPWLTAHLTTATDCTGVRIYTSRQNAQVSAMQMEAYYNAQWNLFFDGNPSDGAYIT